MSFSNEYTLNVDIKKRMSNVVPIFRQGDTAKLNFRAYDNGVLLDLTSYTRSEISFSLPSGRTLVNECTLENGLISYEFSGVEMAEVGNVSVIVSIYSGTTVVSIQPFRIHIYDNMRGQELSYISILQDLITEVSIFKDELVPLAEEIHSLKEGLEPLVIAVKQGEVERVSNEDERIFNENERIQDESQREDNESVRITNETGRQSKEAQRATSESGRATAESTRVSNESNRVITEGLRVSAENTRNTNETNRVTKEADRVTKETDRVTKETQRVTAETARETKEATRLSNEQIRSQAETERIQNEDIRIQEENERLDNETARILSETTRETAEVTRVSNESDRVSVEAQRVIAESNRANSETTRVSKETERLNAETVRASNETTRENNEQSRNQAETLRSQNETARSNDENTRKSNEITREQNELLRQETLSEMTEIVDNFDLRGQYSNSITYEKFNTVTYNGSSYMALKTVTGIVPTDDGVNWRILAQRGVDGNGSVNSVNGVMPDTNGNIVIPATEAIDRLDSTSTTNALSANKGRELKEMFDNIEFDTSDVIVTSETEPTTQSENGLWFDVSDTAFDSIDIENAVVSTTPPTNLSLLWLDENTEGNIALKKNINGVWKTLNPKTNVNQVIELISGKTLDVLLNELKGKVSGLVNAKEFGVEPSEVRGNSSSLQAMINKVRQDFIASNLTIQPVVNLEPGVYILDAEVKMSPYLKFRTFGTVIFKITHNGTGIHITPNADDRIFNAAPNATDAPYHKKQFWNRGKYFEGTFVFTSNRNHMDINNQTIALEIGQRTELGAGRPTSRYTVEQINVFGVATAIKLNTINNYIGTFENCHIEHVRHAFVWGNNGQYAVNSGEKFNIKDCLIAGTSSHAILHNVGGIDLTITNTSFDFCTGPIFHLKSTGHGIRLTNSYVEGIEGQNPILMRCEATSEYDNGGRNSLYINGLQMLLHAKVKLIENTPLFGTSVRCPLNISVNGLEVRYIDDARNVPLPVKDAFLFDTDDNLIIFSKDLIFTREHQFSALTSSSDVACNGDFALSTVGAFSGDTYWGMDKSSGKSVVVGSNGINGSKSLDVTVTNTAQLQWLALQGLHKIPAKAGQYAVVMPSIKTPNVDNKFLLECTVVCYNAANNEIGSATGRTYYTGYTATQTVFDEYHYPLRLPIIELPKGTVSIVPHITLITSAGSPTTTYSINNIYVALMGD